MKQWKTIKILIKTKLMQREVIDDGLGAHRGGEWNSKIEEEEKMKL